MSRVIQQWFLRLATVRHVLVMLPAVLLIACGGGADTETNQDPNNSAGVVVNYNGPAPVTADVQSFKLNVWDNLSTTNRCGSCHVQNGQAPQFVRNDDINLAYTAANSVVNLSSPASSLMVSKVAGGHNCWLDDNAACGDIITSYITDWINGTSSETAELQLVAPPLRTPGTSKSIPGDPGLFASTIYPVVSNVNGANCGRCHSASASQQNRQSPYFADADIDAAYAAAIQKIDLDNPANSRLVLRLRQEFHNCWKVNPADANADDCADSAQLMENAIIAFASAAPVTQVDPSLVISNSMRLLDGIEAAGGPRHESNLVAKWEFKTGSGSTAYDTSGLEPAMNLSLSGSDVNWVGGYGIDVRNGKAQATTASSKKLYDMIRVTGEYTMEAWVVPANVTQQGARIMSYSGSADRRNMAMMQNMYSYRHYHRADNADPAQLLNGEPLLETAAADEDAQATLQHVVMTYTPSAGRRIYVNGVYTDDADSLAGDTINGWNNNYAFVLGNEVFTDPNIPSQWQGIIRFAAVHNRALSDQQISENHAAGVGQKFYLLFNISSLVNIPDSYIMFEVSQFDSYAYLFDRPTYINLGTNNTIGNIPLRGLRIGINGKLAVVGQAYSHLDTVVNSNNQLLSDIGTVIALEQGPGLDEFFLSFETIASRSSPFIEAPPQAPAAQTPIDRSDIGLRVFDEINATLSQLTGVPRTNGFVMDTYSRILQQLPAVENIETFVPANQVAIAQLAIQYCDIMVEDDGLRATFFNGDIAGSVDSAFGSGYPTTVKTRVIDALHSRVFGIPRLLAPVDLVTAPARAQFEAELFDPANSNNLFDRLRNRCGGASCTATDTRNILKSMCAATLGSAVMLIQ